MALRSIILGLPLASLLAVVSGSKHHLFVGNLYPPASIYALEFDDEALSFRITNNITADAPHAWISFNHDKTNLYGTALKNATIASYAVTSNSTLKLIRTLEADKDCKNHTSAFVIASPVKPYPVFTGAWPGPAACGMSLAVNANGSLDKVVDSWSYANKSGIHGLALGGPNSSLLYSADLNGDAIWTHKFNPVDAKVTQVASYPFRPNTHPRHLASHPNGKYLYSVMESGNSVSALTLDNNTWSVRSEASSYSLIPDNSNSSNYWSAEVMLSPNAKYLWATARAQINTTFHGYISSFLIDNDGSIVKKMFMVPTTTTGGIANAISPAPWGEEWAAMTDVPTGYVQIWKMTGGSKTDKGTEYKTAEAVTRVDIADGGCCANAIWYD